jgi:hypothetical protein
MKGLSVLGMVAMFLVGGGILVHGIPWLHHGVEHLAHVVARLPALGGLLGRDADAGQRRSSAWSPAPWWSASVELGQRVRARSAECAWSRTPSGDASALALLLAVRFLTRIPLPDPTARTPAAQGRGAVLSIPSSGLLLGPCWPSLLLAAVRCIGAPPRPWPPPCCSGSGSGLTGACTSTVWRTAPTPGSAASAAASARFEHPQGPAHRRHGMSWAAAAAAAVAAALMLWGWRRTLVLRLGGYTGDGLGALVELSETLVLLAVALAVAADWSAVSAASAAVS